MKNIEKPEGTFRPSITVCEFCDGLVLKKEAHFVSVPGRNATACGVCAEDLEGEGSLIPSK